MPGIAVQASFLKTKMKRKIVKHGPSSLTISLPAKWVHKNNLKQGDELDFEELGSKLIFGKELTPLKKKIELDFTNLEPRHIKWILLISYKEGYDEIVAKFDDPATINTIEREISLCPGLEILEQSQKGCIIKNIAKNLEDEFDRAVRRNFLNTMSMIELCVKKIKDKKLNELNELLKFEETNNKLTSLCERMININKTRGEKAVFAYTIISQIEKVTDDFKFICEYFSEHSKTNISQETIKLLEAVQTMFRSYYELYYSFELKKQIKITDQYNIIKQKAYAMMTSRNSDETIMLHLLTKASERILECISSTFALNTESFEIKQ